MTPEEAQYWVQFWTNAEEQAYRQDDTAAYERAYFNKIAAERQLHALAPQHVTDGPIDTTDEDRVLILQDMERLARGETLS